MALAVSMERENARSSESVAASRLRRAVQTTLDWRLGSLPRMTPYLPRASAALSQRRRLDCGLHIRRASTTVR